MGSETRISDRAIPESIKLWNQTNVYHTGVFASQEDRDKPVIIDKNGIVKYINPSYTRITKISKDEILNKKLLEDLYYKISVTKGEVVRYELDNLWALNFVMYDALGGGVTRSLAIDKHGKSLSSALLEMEI